MGLDIFTIQRGFVGYGLYATYDEAFERMIALGWRDADVVNLLDRL